MGAILAILAWIGGAVVIVALIVIGWIVKDVWKWSRSH